MCLGTISGFSSFAACPKYRVSSRRNARPRRNTRFASARRVLIVCMRRRVSSRRNVRLCSSPRLALARCAIVAPWLWQILLHSSNFTFSRFCDGRWSRNARARGVVGTADWLRRSMRQANWLLKSVHCIGLLNHPDPTQDELGATPTINRSLCGDATLVPKLF